MNASDFLGIGKVLPIDKLLEIVSTVVGRLSKSYFDRKDVDTKAYERKKIAEADAEGIKIIAKAINENYELTGGIEYKGENIVVNSQKDLLLKYPESILINPTIEERVKGRIGFQEVKKQLNIENVTIFAIEELKNEQSVTDESLDADWITRFFRIVEDVSNEEMQAIWGKILAGEIKQPKSYSLRTLELLRNLSKKEADVFVKVANFSFKSGDVSFIYKGDNDDKLSKDFGISYMDIALLKEVGLMQSGDFVHHRYPKQHTDTQQILTIGNIVIIIKIKANTPTISMPVDVFSSIGNELLNLILPNAPFDYLRYLANSIKNENVEVKYANIMALEGDMITYAKPLCDF